MSPRLVVGILLLLLLPGRAGADYLEVRRAAIVRAEPNRSAEELSRPQVGATLQLLGEGQLQEGYYPVTDPQTSRSGWIYKTFVRRHAEGLPAPPAPEPPTKVTCASRLPLKVHFYDVGQALAALVELPDGRRVLVDAGESPTRPGCGAVCKDKHNHLLERLAADLEGKPISMLWITHQHSDHVGGAPDVLKRFKVEVYVDNGQALGTGQVGKARNAARDRGTYIKVIEPSRTTPPIPGSGDALKLRAIVPSPPSWPDDCEDDPNNCSIGLRIDYCSSSVLFTGDAEDLEEDGLEPGQVTLLQVGHHGSETSTSEAFLKKVSPKYAVISAGRKGEGLNRTYCHPRKVTVVALAKTLGGTGAKPITSFDGISCRRASKGDWKEVRVSNHLWATSRDGDITLATNGDGVFEEQAN